MTTATRLFIVSAMTSAAEFIQRDFDRGTSVPGQSPAAVEMRDAAVAVGELLDAVKHEGSIRAINAGANVSEWRDHLSPVLRATYDRAGGQP